MFSILPIVLMVCFFFIPDFASAQGFVTCFGTDCNACNLAEMANKMIIFLFGVIGMIFAILMMIAGFGLVTSGGNTSALEAAKSKFKNAIIGLIIVMGAWLAVDTLMRGLLKGGAGEIEGWGPWSDVQCQLQTQTVAYPGDPASPTVPGGPPPPPPLPGPAPTACSGGTCAELGIPCSNPSKCKISPDLVAKFQAFHAAAGVAGARVTEAMPPTRVHKSVCHTQGTCVDYSKQGGMTPAEVLAVVNAAKANGLRPVYEVKTQAQKDALTAGGVPAGSVMVLGSWISAPHFSIYGY